MPNRKRRNAARRKTYTRWMTPEDAADFRTTPADTDPDEEIRLMRLAVGKLSADVVSNHVSITRILVVLCRALGMKAKQESAEGNVRQELEEAGEAVLQSLEQAGSDAE